MTTKLTATLSPADMRKDVWLDQTPFFEKKNRLFSWQGALTTALNWGAGLFAAGLLVICLLAFAGEMHKTKLPRRIGIVTVTSIVFAGLFYLCLPKIEVKLVRGFSSRNLWEQKMTFSYICLDANWQSLAQARAELQESPRLKNWGNDFVGGLVREEDSPGNYLLRETNNQLRFIFINADGGEEIARKWNLPRPQ